MKLITLVNDQYLSHKQCGIQSTHVATELSVNYADRTKENDYYRDWANNHKTVIFLAGGNCVTLQQIYDDMLPHAKVAGIPLALFREDATLNFALTAVGIVMPDEGTVSGYEGYMISFLRSYLNKFKLLN